MKRRTGIYSGTFDPVHPGHVAFAEAAMQICNLDEVVFVPERMPRGKERVTDISHRIALIERATAATAGLRAIQLVSKQFDVERTLPELYRTFGEDELTFLVGSDVVRTFLYRWAGLDILLANNSLAIGMRSNDDRDEITTIMDHLEHDYDIPVDYTLISTPEAGIASSQIRNSKIDMSRLHPRVLAYMQEHHLYVQP
jgi:nicotinate-nucleotide adenylyltransferase